MSAPIVFASAISNPGGTGSTLTVTLPSHAVDDVLIIYVANTGNVLWTGNPTGWSRIDQRTVGTSSNGIVGTWLYRKIVSGDTLPLSNPVCTLGATVTRAAICRTIRGADREGVFTLGEWGARGFATGTANPIRPPTVVTPAPEMLILHCYGQRSSTNAPEPTNYTQDQEIIISGTLVLNASQRTISDQQISLVNQDASPTSGVRWAAGILCIPSPDYAYYRSGSQATTASGTSVTPVKPTGTTNSDVNSRADVMIATVEGSGSTTLSAQDGALWTAIGTWSTTTSGGGSSIKKFWAKATASPNMQFNRTGTGEISACITTYHNCDQVSPIGNVNVRQNASSTTSTWDAQNRSATKSTIMVSCVTDGVPSFTTPSGWTERMDGLGIVCSDQTFNATGSTASASFTLSSASPNAVGLVELLGFASAVEFSRTSVISGTGTISTSSTLFSVFTRSALVSGSGDITSSAKRDLLRSVSFSATGSITSSGEASTPIQTFERSASLSSTSSIESSGQFFSVFERLASLDSTSTLSTNGIFFSVLDRSGSLSGTSLISSTGSFFSILTGTVSIGSSGVIETSAISFSVFSRSGAIDSTGSIQTTAQFFSTLNRSASLDTIGSIGSSGLSTLERSASIVATSQISASGIKVLSRTVSLGTLGNIGSQGVVIVSRSVSIESVGNVLVSGVGFSVFERAISLSGQPSVSVNGHRVLDRTTSFIGAGQISASGEVSGITEFERSASFSSTGTFSTSFQRELIRSSGLTILGSISVSGEITGFTVYERAASLGLTGQITASSIVFHPVGILDTGGESRTLTTGAESRSQRISFQNRTA